MNKALKILQNVSRYVSTSEIEREAGIPKGALRYWLREERSLTRSNYFKLLRWYAREKAATVSCPERPK